MKAASGPLLLDRAGWRVTAKLDAPKHFDSPRYRITQPFGTPTRLQ